MNVQLTALERKTEEIKALEMESSDAWGVAARAFGEMTAEEQWAWLCGALAAMTVEERERMFREARDLKGE